MNLQHCGFHTLFVEEDLLVRMGPRRSVGQGQAGGLVPMQKIVCLVRMKDVDHCYRTVAS